MNASTKPRWVAGLTVLLTCCVCIEPAPGTPTPPPDSDYDGLLDSWEVQHFGDLTQNGYGDPDNDGWTNLQEYQNGTNPNAVDQPFKVRITQPVPSSSVP